MPAWLSLDGHGPYVLGSLAMFVLVLAIDLWSALRGASDLDEGTDP
jgi:hypothetical protein